jgi:cobalt-zinc-cadmium efflux system membrane fusion protein
MMKINIYGFIVFLSVLVLGACSTGQQDDANVEDPVSAASLTTHDNNDKREEANNQADSIGNFISVRGYVDVPPEQRVSVSPFYGGYVKEIKVLPGTRVDKGEVLFTMENPLYIQLQEQYLEAKEQLEYLKEDYERQKVLSTEEIVSRKNYKKAESDYKVMTAKTNGLRERLNMLGLSIAAIEKGQFSSSVSVKSTINGNVTAVNIQKGIYLDPKDVAVNIINADHLHLELEVFEQDASRIEKGQKIRFTIPEMSQQEEYEGSVHLVVPSIDLQKRTILVHGHIDDEHESAFLPGMDVEANIMVGE